MRTNPNVMKVGRPAPVGRQVLVLLQVLLQPFVDESLEPIYRHLERCSEEQFRLITSSARLTELVVDLALELRRELLGLFRGDGFQLEAAWFEREWTNVQRRRHKHRMKQVMKFRRRHRRFKRPVDPERQEYNRQWYERRGKFRKRHPLRGSLSAQKQFCPHCGALLLRSAG